MEDGRAIWASLSWSQAKFAAKVRGFEVPDLEGLEEEERLRVRNSVLPWLHDWTTSWGAEAHTPPEFYQADKRKVRAEAELLEIEVPINIDDTSTRRRIVVKIVKIHMELRKKYLEDFPEELDREMYDEDTPPMLSHEGGIAIATGSGKALTFFPQQAMTDVTAMTPTDEGTRALFMTVVARYYEVKKDTETVIRRDLYMVTGLDHDSTCSNVNYELTSRKTLSTLEMSKSELEETPEVTTTEEADQTIAKADEERKEEGMEDEYGFPTFVRVQEMKGDFEEGDENESLPYAPTFVTTHFANLPRESKTISIAKETGESRQGSKTNPIYAIYTKKGEGDRKARLEVVEKHLMLAYKVSVEGHARNLEAYKQPKEGTNLVTGKQMDPDMTPVMKIFDQRLLQSSDAAAEEVKPICISCTFDKMSASLETDEELDFTDKGVLEEHLVFGLHSNSRACHRCSCSLHPHPTKPTECPHCDVVVFCEGRLRQTCDSCEHTYFLPSDSSVRENMNTLRNGKDRRMLEEARVYAYARVLGGNSELLGNARFVEDARARMKTQIIASGGLLFNFDFSPRHLIFGPLLMFTEDLHGVNGLCLRDFISRSAFEKLDPKALEKAVGFWRGITALTTEELMTSYIKKGTVKGDNYTAPEWAEADGALEENQLGAAMKNCATFVRALGVLFRGDVNASLAELTETTSGLRSEQACITEHRHACLYSTWSERVWEQPRDFGIDQRYQFEKDANRMGPSLFYCSTAPKILMQVSMSVDRGMREEGAKAAYSGRFNHGKMGLSQTPLPNPKPKDKKKGQTGGLNAGTPTTKNAFETWDEDTLSKPLEWAAGVIGDRIPNLFELQQKEFLVPKAKSGKLICIMNLVGKCNPGDLACCYEHETPENIPMEITRGLLAAGGTHTAMPLTLNSIRPWCPSCFLGADNTMEQITQIGLRAVDLVLEGCLEMHTSKHSNRLVVEGKCTREEHVIVGPEEGPLKLFSSTGVPITEVHSATFGIEKTFVEGLRYRTPSKTSLVGQEKLLNRCLAIAVASQLSMLPNYIREEGASWELEMIREICTGLLELDVSSVDPHNRAAEIFHLCSNPDEEGYNEALFDIISPVMMARHNVLMVSEGGLLDPGDRSKVNTRLWTAGNTMRVARESIARPQKYAAKFLGQWDWGHEAECAALAAVCSTYNKDEFSKHTDGFKPPKKLQTLQQITAHMETMITTGDRKFEMRVCSTGQWDQLASEQALGLTDSPLTTAQLLKDRDRISLELRRINECSVEYSQNQFWQWGVAAEERRKDARTPSSPEEVAKENVVPANAATANTPGWGAGARFVPANAATVHTPNAQQVRAQGGAQGATQGIPTSTTLKMVNAGIAERLKAAAKSDSVSLQLAAKRMLAVQELGPKVDWNSTDSLQDFLEQIGEHDRLWREEETHSPYWKGELEKVHPHGRMLHTLRKIAFGESRINDGAALEDIPDEFGLAIGEAHCSKLEELLQVGLQSARLGPREGYVGENREGVDAALLQILTSYVKHIRGWKCLSFVMSPEELKAFAKGDENYRGGIIAPTDVVEKKDDRGRLRYDKETGVQKLRPILDNSDNGGGRTHNAHAKNGGVWSFRFSRQMATDKSTMAACAIEEENANPGYFLQAVKLDYEDAFPTEGCHVEDVNDLCAVILNLLIVYGNYTFGGADAPGVWEVLASAVSSAAGSMEWPDPELDGATIPRNNRMVDDTVHIVADRGNRQPRYLGGFKALMQWLAGPSSNNAEKEEEAGGFSFYQHTYGDLMDTYRRRMSTPLSRLCRGEDKVLSYLNDKNREFTAGELPSVRGTLNSNFSNAKQLSFFLDRLDAMQSDMAVKFGQNPPKDYHPSPALKGESEEAGRANLRAELEVAWRLATLGNGKYMYSSFEQCLDPNLREVVGRPEENLKRFCESDASGDGYFWFDPVTGKHFSHFWDPEEKEAFNNFELLITNGEYLPVVCGLPFLLRDHPDAKRFVSRMDNKNVVTAIQEWGSRNANNLECTIIIGILSYCFDVDMETLYVLSEDNIRADPGSRLAKQSELQQVLRQWEEEKGITPHTEEVPKEWTDVSHWCDKEMPSSEKLSRIYKKVLSMLGWLEEQGVTARMRVPVEDVRLCIKEMLEGKTVPELDRSKEDFPTQTGPSPQRQVLLRKGKTVRTRTSLKRQVSTRPQAETKLRAEAGLSPDADQSKVFGKIMQEQAKEREILWVPSEKYNPDTPLREGAKVIRQPFAHLKDDKIRVAELFASYAAITKGFEGTGGGVGVALAECNTVMHAHQARTMPHAKLFTDNAELTSEELTKLRVEVVAGGPDCQSHSQGNRSAKGRADVAGGGQAYEKTPIDATEAYGGFGVAAIILENPVGITKKRGGSSAYEEMRKNCRNYHEGLGEKVKAWEVKSPLTDHVAPLHHERFWSVPLNKWCFPSNAKVKLEKGEPPKRCVAFLDTEEETAGRFVMPDEDVTDFEHKFEKRGRVAYTGSIADPPQGHGEGDFPTRCWSPKDGDMVTFTGAGGKWMLMDFNGKTSMVLVNNGDAMRTYGMRDTEPEWWDSRNEIGRLVPSHSVVQSVGDAVANGYSDLYTSPLSPSAMLELGFTGTATPREIFSLFTEGVEIAGATWVGRPDGKVPPGWHSPSSKDATTQKRHGNTGNTGGLRSGTDAKVFSSKSRTMAIRKNRNLLSDTHTKNAEKLPSMKLQSYIEKRGKAPPPSKKQRPKYEATVEQEAAIDRRLAERTKLQKQLRHHAGCRHMVDYYDAKGWETPIRDPLDLVQQERMERYCAYEVETHGIKGSSVYAKVVGVNAAHESLGLLPPFSTSPIVSRYLTELKSQDAPPQGKLPVSPAVTEHFVLTHDINIPRVRQKVLAQVVGRRWHLRSIEYLSRAGKTSKLALKWKDVYFRNDEVFFTGKEVLKATKVTLSILSSKNKLGRCTRSTSMVEEDELDAIKLLIIEYMSILERTGKEPEAEAFVFELEDQPGKVLSREEISADIQGILMLFGVPKHLAGSHSLRRAGPTMMKAAGVPDEDIKRWGRWTSDAYKVYIHVDMQAMDSWQTAISKARPIYELN